MSKSACVFALLMFLTTILGTGLILLGNHIASMVF